MTRIVFPFRRMNDAELDVSSEAIVTACTGNPHLPVLPPQFTALTTALTDYRTALAVAASGNKTDIILKNQKKELLVNALVAFGYFVVTIANDDEAIISSLGYEVSGDPQPMPPISKPEIIRIMDGPNVGELKVEIRSVKGARLYLYQCTPDPLTAANQWTSQSSTTSKSLLKNFESGKKYWSRVVAYGTGEQVVYSEPVSRIVQ
jgi:hypothetical protein